MKLIGNETTKVSAANEDQLAFRDKLWKLRNKNPLPEAELERNPALFLRGSMLSRILAVNEVYKKIVAVPGVIFDLGCWWGQNAVLFENLRAIYEPFNKQRKIVCFDSFQGYVNWTEKDKKSKIYKENAYATSEEYDVFLRELLEIHEGNNNLGHQRGIHEVVKGDATLSVANFLNNNPGTVVALAAFDLGLYEPTKKVLHAIKPHLVRGSILWMIHLTRPELRGDGQAFLEEMKGMKYKISKIPFYPSMSVVEIL